MFFFRIHLMKEFFPAVLCHESEKRQKCPAEAVEAGVAVVWVSSDFEAVESVRTLPVERKHVQSNRQLYRK